MTFRLCQQCGRVYAGHVYAGHAFVDSPSTEVIHAQVYQTHTENATMQVERGKAPIVITLSERDAVALIQALGKQQDSLEQANVARDLREAISRALSSSD